MREDKNHTGSNIPEYSVSELSFSLKKTLEAAYGHVRVRGELSRVKVHTSGHMYSVLKDENSSLNAVCWKNNLSRLGIRPEEGMEVICTGRISTYPARSNYQIIIEQMELAGEGALLKMLEERKKRLAAEGLFSSSRKKSIPFLPDRIGVITSATGAVIRDIMHRLNDRFPRHVMLWPVPVQGEGAARQIENAIKGFNSLKEPCRPDVIILARGGGSLEDLMAFNEENVVRAIAAGGIPLISAVGHETDTTLSDYAADLRAPTPTGAAEMAVPRRMDLLYTVRAENENLLRVTSRLWNEKNSRLENISLRLGDPAYLLEVKTQRTDHLSHKLDSAFDYGLSLRRENLIRTGARLRTPAEKLREKIGRLEIIAGGLGIAKGRLLKEPLQRLEHSSRMLESLSYNNVIKRGFVVVRDENERLLTDAEMIESGQKLELEFRGNRKIGAIASGR
jgi:exodeoxyribonuclease VII large subunit